MNKFFVKSIKKLVKKTGRGMGHCKNVLFDPSPKLLVLVFHRIVSKIISDPLNIMLSEKKFIRQLDALAGKYPVISLSDAVRQAESGKVKAKCQVVLTFDDGYRDNYEVAFPVLRKKGVPATFFIASDYIDSSVPLWDFFLISMLFHNKIDDIHIGNNIVRKKAVESRPSFVFRAFDEIKSLEPEKRHQIIDLLRIRAGSGGSVPTCAADRCMTWEDARKMSHAGMEFGSHGTSHTSLARVTGKVAEKEIMASKDIIERNIQKRCDHFAFPFGSRRDYSDALVASVGKAGYKTCLLNVHGYNYFDKDFFCLKRIIMDECTDVRHILG